MALSKRAWDSNESGVWGASSKNKYVGATSQQQNYFVGNVDRTAIDRTTAKANDAATPKHFMDLARDRVRVLTSTAAPVAGIPNDTLILFT